MRPVAQVAVVRDGEHRPPVFSSYAAIHFQRSRGLSLPSGGQRVNGSTWTRLRAVVAEDDVAVQVVAAVFDVHS
jgi:hypothetical protein